MTTTQGKTPAQSAVLTRYMVMPQDANPFGTAFGGVIMSWIDMVGSMAAHGTAGRRW
jgi:acyl-CoA hydrolase